MNNYLNHFALISLINLSNEIVNNRPISKQVFFNNYFEVEVNSNEWNDLSFITMPEKYKLN